MSNEKNKAAALLGKLGGAARSEAKADAARTNGTKGGRPFRVDLEKARRSAVLSILEAELVRLKQFAVDDPQWNRWNKSIQDREMLLKKFDNQHKRPDLSKGDLISIVQLLAAYIGKKEKSQLKNTADKASSEPTLADSYEVAEQLDELLGKPSVFEHYLRESRRQYSE